MSSRVCLYVFWNWQIYGKSANRLILSVRINPIMHSPAHIFMVVKLKFRSKLLSFLLYQCTFIICFRDVDKASLASVSVSPRLWWRSQPVLGSHLKVHWGRIVRWHGCCQDLVPQGQPDWEPQLLLVCWPETTFNYLPRGLLQHGSLFHQTASSSWSFLISNV